MSYSMRRLMTTSNTGSMLGMHLRAFRRQVHV